MRIAALIVAALLVSACSPGVEERKAYWKSLLASEVPIGSSKDQVIQWSEKHGGEFSFYEKDHTLYAKAERIPTTFDLACREWDIMIRVGFNADNVSTSQKVEAAGICL